MNRNATFKNEVKANIIRSGFTMQEVVEKLAQRGPRKIIDFVGRGGAAERVSFHACVEANDTEPATTIWVEQQRVQLLWQAEPGFPPLSGGGGAGRRPGL